MSPEADRIPAPTNGHKPRQTRRKPRPAVEAPVLASTAADANQSPEAVAKVTSPEMTVSVTPAQIAVGFGVIAGIILLVLGRRRGRGRR
jgi:hypothetical protein